MRLRERGLTIRGAAREIGISRATANNWSRGYKVYRRGQLVGFVPALERLAVRQISPRFLSQDERIEIADRARQVGVSARSRSGWVGHPRRSRGSYAATRSPAAGIARSMPIVTRPRAGLAIIVDASRPTPSCSSWSRSCWRSDGAHSRSAVTCAGSSPSSRECGCVTRASISRDRIQGVGRAARGRGPRGRGDEHEPLIGRLPCGRPCQIPSRFASVDSSRANQRPWMRRPLTGKAHAQTRPRTF
jgi:hypothetical protein